MFRTARLLSIIENTCLLSYMHRGGPICPSLFCDELCTRYGTISGVIAVFVIGLALQQKVQFILTQIFGDATILTSQHGTIV